MKARLGTWWQEIRKPLVITGIMVAFIGMVVLIAIVIHVYGTGFDGYDKVSTTRTISGPSSGIVTRTEEYQPGKTLWDWLQLLIIPAVLAVGGYLFNLATSRTEREIALDRQREDVLQEYINKISELLLKEGLRKSAEDAEVRKIARVRTLTVLPRLDANRKRSVLQFLHESSLIDKVTDIIELRGADLRGAGLREADLYSANLSEIDLHGADLIEANLYFSTLERTDLARATLRKSNLLGADLSEANLSGADLSKANLQTTNLSGAKLIKANLSGANLYGANLRGADLAGTNLAGTYMRGADLRDVRNTTPRQLKKAGSRNGAIIPHGSKTP